MERLGRASRPTHDFGEPAVSQALAGSLRRYAKRPCLTLDLELLIQAALHP